MLTDSNRLLLSKSKALKRTNGLERSDMVD